MNDNNKRTGQAFYPSNDSKFMEAGKNSLYMN